MSLPSAQDAKELFDLAKGFTNFNHGSFGAVAKKVKARQNELHLLAEARPDRWFRETIYTLSKESRTRVASMIEASVDDVVLVENASTAINAILRGRLQKGDKVLRFSNTYNMCIETFKWLGVEQVVVDINFPVVDDKTLIDDFSKAMEANPDIKLCLFCHIASFPTIIEPVEAFTAIAKSVNKDCIVLIDGAHAPGQLNLNMEELSDLGVDYYTGNLHKWCYTPKGCAFMWTADRSGNKDYEGLAPTVISSTGMTSYADRFAYVILLYYCSSFLFLLFVMSLPRFPRRLTIIPITQLIINRHKTRTCYAYRYTGTRDYTAFCAIPAALDFCNELGGHSTIFKRNHDLIIAGAKICVERWGTFMLCPEASYGVMADIVLPSNDYEKVLKVVKRLEDDDDTYFLAKEYTVGGETRIISRISANLYLELSDFTTLAEKVLQYLEDAA
jgi:hypothetical protein